ncbi:hypothetical protein E8E13_000074 [Curvularia kusanoi]|uniref:N-acetyltransferase domain-containing protein n=1 Tax=Curvularia kusanoi TaxID=90978 RepID=A0A9P4T390_CURKU|nr:hypothetical protein E8E13_000074 [Curvularia kusanoi]
MSPQPTLSTSIPTSIPNLTLRPYRPSDTHALFALESHPANARYQTWTPWTLLEAQQRLNEALLSASLQALLSASLLSSEREREVEVVELAIVFEGRLIGRVGGRVSCVGIAAGTGLSDSQTMNPQTTNPQTTNPQTTNPQTTDARPLQTPSDAEKGTASEIVAAVKKHKHIDLWFSLLPEMQGRGFATAAVEAFLGEVVKNGERGTDGEFGIELEIECDPRNEGSCRMAQRLGFVKHSEVERAFECKGEMVGSVVWRKVV